MALDSGHFESRTRPHLTADEALGRGLTVDSLTEPLRFPAPPQKVTEDDVLTAAQEYISAKDTARSFRKTLISAFTPWKRADKKLDQASSRYHQARHALISQTIIDNPPTDIDNAADKAKAVTATIKELDQKLEEIETSLRQKGSERWYKKVLDNKKVMTATGIALSATFAVSLVTGMVPLAVATGAGKIALSSYRGASTFHKIEDFASSKIGERSNKRLREINATHNLETRTKASKSLGYTKEVRVRKNEAAKIGSTEEGLENAYYQALESNIRRELTHQVRVGELSNDEAIKAFLKHEDTLHKHQEGSLKWERKFTGIRVASITALSTATIFSEGGGIVKHIGNLGKGVLDRLQDLGITPTVSLPNIEEAKNALGNLKLINVEDRSVPAQMSPVSPKTPITEPLTPAETEAIKPATPVEIPKLHRFYGEDTEFKKLYGRGDMSSYKGIMEYYIGAEDYDIKTTETIFDPGTGLPSTQEVTFDYNNPEHLRLFEEAKKADTDYEAKLKAAMKYFELKNAANIHEIIDEDTNLPIPGVVLHHNPITGEKVDFILHPNFDKFFESEWKNYVDLDDVDDDSDDEDDSLLKAA